MSFAGVCHEYLHEEFCSRAKVRVPFDDEVNTFWWEWLAWRGGNPFTLGDLRLVIVWLRHEVRAGKSHPDALQFLSLVGKPEKFERGLARATEWFRRRSAIRANRSRHLVRPLAAQKTGALRAAA